MKCFSCSEDGHKAAKCPKKPKRVQCSTAYYKEKKRLKHCKYLERSRAYTSMKKEKVITTVAGGSEHSETLNMNEFKNELLCIFNMNEKLK